MQKAELLKSLNQFYIYSNEGLFIDKVIENNEYKLVYSKYVNDYDSNYVIDIKNKEDFYKTEKDILTKMKKLDRTPCYIITPLSDIYKNRDMFFSKNNYKKVSNEVWLIYEDFKNLDKIKPKCNVNIKLEKTTNMEKFAEVTYKSFCTNDGSDPYGNFNIGYYNLYKNYNNRSEKKYIREFYFIKINEEIVGCTVSIFDDKIFGIYGLAVMKEYRGKGIGTQVIKEQLKSCKQKNKPIAFLQTEEGFYPANLYRKIGFQDICNVNYYIKND